jgi:hypothetical protein
MGAYILLFYVEHEEQQKQSAVEGHRFGPNVSNAAASARESALRAWHRLQSHIGGPSASVEKAVGRFRDVLMKRDDKGLTTYTYTVNVLQGSCILESGLQLEHLRLLRCVICYRNVVYRNYTIPIAMLCVLKIVNVDGKLKTNNLITK